ncbi:KEOPS complex subunit Pcc1 [Salinirubellus salinus]|uniref:KEOPS complex subunit Pcc1 n=1 Tax=Salinirubellus salinus TaxID=1364945 RepID=A0A9E7U8V4_9EURY|nr:KEOPS complex subunit Pcc1 [Salinirubellus salinus]UWM55231.1 KEOPS complex subunit Pcc1 [Salinirubellus salinus]
MTGADADERSERPERATRRATLRTTHADATAVARALAPDNTAEMHTRVEGSTVVTTVARETTGGLRSTVDDYVTNMQVADELHTDAQTEERTHTDTNTDTNE